MAIVSGVFWIMVGLIYILYQCFKEEPIYAAAGTLWLGILFACIGAFWIIISFCFDTNTVLGAVSGISVAAVVAALAIMYFVRLDRKQQEHVDRLNRFFDRKMRAYEIMSQIDITDDELRAFAEEKWVHCAPQNMSNYRLHYEWYKPQIEKMYRERVMLPKIMEQLEKGRIQ